MLSYAAAGTMSALLSGPTRERLCASDVAAATSALVALMRAWPADANVQHAACTALGQAAALGGDAADETGAIAAVTRALLHFPSHTDAAVECQHDDDDDEVDASGTTDAEGAAGAGDPLADVAWVRRELHAWVFSNVRAKWGALRKKAMPRHAGADPDAPLARLCELFSGYRAPRAAVLLSLRRAALDAGRLSCGRDGIPGWAAADVHRLVACFLRVRFPVVLALNKADLPDAARYVAALRAALPGEAAVSCAAAAEWWLANAVAAGRVAYEEGAGAAACTPAADDATRDKLAALQKSVFGPWGGTGVLCALSTAVALRAPLLILPVTAADISEDPPPGEPLPRGALRHGVLLRPGATLDDAFLALRREKLADGELVRAERIALDAARKASVLRTEDGALKPGPGGVIVLRLATNKRTPWQKRGGEE
jgi:hypothetical protein